MHRPHRFWLRGSVMAIVMGCAVSHVDAAPVAPGHLPTSYFLAANPHVPLAVVRGSTITSAVRPEARGRSDTRFFEVPNGTGGTTRLAVGSRCGGWLVASLANASWTVVNQVHGGKPTQRVCYRPLAVFDMNGDGTPEIALRFIEDDGVWWGESVLKRSAAGRWTEVAGSPGGSTA